MMDRIDLCGEWQFLDNHGTVRKGNVPGCVHTDLFTADEMYWEKNSLNCQYIEEQSWIYKKQFEVPCIYKDAELVFEGLDTYCDIYLNDTLMKEHHCGYTSFTIELNNLNYNETNILIACKI